MTTQLPKTLVTHPATLYDTDYQQWLLTTIEQLQKRNFNAVEWENLIEELDGLAKQQQHELENQMCSKTILCG